MSPGLLGAVMFLSLSGAIYRVRSQTVRTRPVARPLPTPPATTARWLQDVDNLGRSPGDGTGVDLGSLAAPTAHTAHTAAPILPTALMTGSLPRINLDRLPQVIGPEEHQGW